MPAKTPAKKTPKKTTTPRHKMTDEPQPIDAAMLWVDGCSALDISEKLGIPVRTVYRWLQSPDMTAAIEKEIAFREITRRRLLGRHYRRLYDFAADVAAGKQKIKDEHQARMLNAFLQLDAGHTAAPGQPISAPTLALPEGAPQIPAGATVILQYNGDRPPLEPRVMRGTDDDADVIEADRA